MNRKLNEVRKQDGKWRLAPLRSYTGRGKTKDPKRTVLGTLRSSKDTGRLEQSGWEGACWKPRSQRWQWAKAFQVMLRFRFRDHCKCWAKYSLKTFVGKRIIVAAILGMDYQKTREEMGKPVRRLLQ